MQSFGLKKYILMKFEIGDKVEIVNYGYHPKIDTECQ